MRRFIVPFGNFPPKHLLTNDADDRAAAGDDAVPFQTRRGKKVREGLARSMRAAERDEVLVMVDFRD